MYATRAHKILKAASVAHGYENTGGGTMCTTITRGDYVAVMGEDSPSVYVYTVDAWNNGGEPLAARYEADQYDLDFEPARFDEGLITLIDFV